MKRIIRNLLLAGLLAAVLTVSAFAASFTNCAETLKDLGLFQGTQSGFDLDRAPSRAEAAAMLVRLLGQEDAAKKLTYSAPYTDVPDWAKPYVQYLYANGLTKGQNATAFGSSGSCTAQQYATFLLRALGYSDAAGGDFTYANALAFAREKGVVDAVNCDEKNFLRDHVAAMSYTALATAPKSGEADLLSKLVASGAIKDAKGLDQRFAAYRAYDAAAQATNKATAMSMHMAMDMNISMGDATAVTPYATAKAEGDVAAAIDLAKPDQTQIAMTLDMDMAIDPALAESKQVPADQANQKASMKMYYTGGYLYMDTNGEKIKTPYSLAEVLKGMNLEDAQSGNSICMFSDISAASDGGKTIYHMAMDGDVLAGMVKTAMAAVPSEQQAALNGMSMTFDKLAADMTFEGGAMTGMTMDMSFGMGMMGMKMKADAKAVCTGIKTEGVTVKLPDDLSSYTEVIGSTTGTVQ